MNKNGEAREYTSVKQNAKNNLLRVLSGTLTSYKIEALMSQELTARLYTTFKLNTTSCRLFSGGHGPF